MSETTGAGPKKVKTKTKTKGVRSGLRGWTAATDGASLSRTNTYESPEQAAKAAQRALSAFQKNATPLELKLDGAAVTLRVASDGGRVDDKMKKLAKRFAPKDPAKKAARKAARAAGKEAGADAE
jgi:hypothetical protein